MLADAIEAASRSIQEPTLEKIRNTGKTNNLQSAE